MMIGVLRPLVYTWQAKLGRVSSKGNEAKSKIKHPSDMTIKYTSQQ